MVTEVLLLHDTGNEKDTQALVAVPAPETAGRCVASFLLHLILDYATALLLPLEHVSTLFPQLLVPLPLCKKELLSKPGLRGQRPLPKVLTQLKPLPSRGVEATFKK